MTQTRSTSSSFRAGHHDAAPIPFVDLGGMHRGIRDEIVSILGDIVDESAFIGGPRVEAFEAAFADLCGVRHAVGVGTGTDALRIALQCVGVRPGDAVVTVSMSFFATAEAVLQVGATPVFVDVDPSTCCMDPAALEQTLETMCRPGPDGPVLRQGGARVAAILPVHLYGLPADMVAIRAIADARGVPVVEDAAQAHGAEAPSVEGQTSPCGSLGRMGAFSFYPSKNLGAMGEAGAVTTDDPALAERARMLREHGQSDRYHHQLAEGSNARLDSMQAAVLGVKLRHLEGWTAQRRAIAALYNEAFDAQGLWHQGVGGGGNVYHLYVIQVDERDAVRAALAERGVATGIHYPVPIHAQPAVRGLGLPTQPLPATERLAARCLSLPMYPGMEEGAARRVVEAVLEVTAG